MPRPSSGNRFAPKITIRIARMISSSVKPKFIRHPTDPGRGLNCPVLAQTSEIVPRGPGGPGTVLEGNPAVQDSATTSVHSGGRPAVGRVSWAAMLLTAGVIGL